MNARGWGTKDVDRAARYAPTGRVPLFAFPVKTLTDVAMWMLSRIDHAVVVCQQIKCSNEFGGDAKLFFIFIGLAR